MTKPAKKPQRGRRKRLGESNNSADESLESENDPIPPISDTEINNANMTKPAKKPQRGRRKKLGESNNSADESLESENDPIPPISDAEINNVSATTGSSCQSSESAGHRSRLCSTPHAMVGTTPLAGHELKAQQRREKLGRKQQNQKCPDDLPAEFSRQSSVKSQNALPDCKAAKPTAPPKLAGAVSAANVAKRTLRNVDLMSTSMSPIGEDDYCTDAFQEPVSNPSGSSKKKRSAQTAKQKWQTPVLPIQRQQNTDAVDGRDLLGTNSQDRLSDTDTVHSPTSVAPAGTEIKTHSPVFDASFSYAMSDDTGTEEETASVESIIEELDKDLEKDKDCGPESNSNHASLQNGGKTDLTPILKGVVAFVEVRSGRDDCSEAVKEQVLKMGGEVAPRLNRKVTHVVFKQGRKSTRDTALAFGTHIVSVLWIESCRKEETRVPEYLFPASIPAAFDSALQWKTRKPRSKKASAIDLASSDTEASVGTDPDMLTTCELQRKGPGRKNAQQSGEAGSRPKAGTLTKKEKKASSKAFHSELNHSTIEDPSPAGNNSLDSKGTVAKDAEQSNGENTKLVVAQSSEQIGHQDSKAPNPNVRKRKLYSEKENDILLTPAKDGDTGKRKQKVGPPKERKLAAVPTTRNAHNSLDDFTPGTTKKNATKSADERTVAGLKSDRELPTSPEDNLKRFIPCLPKDIPPTSLVMTNIQPDQQDILSSVVLSLGEFHIRSAVGPTTTHVVCGKPKRTLNMLFGMAQGCWILSPQWVFRSMEAGRWIEEEPFELHDYFPAVQVSRLERTIAGPLYRQNLFTTTGPVYVAKAAVPPPDKLEKLLVLCGGKVASSYHRCAVAVGAMQHKPKAGNVSHVIERWILDCVSRHEVLPFEDYSIN